MPHIPTPLEQLGRRPFSFYPAICSLSHNEWMFRGATGEEIEVENTKSKEILSIPRRFLGGVSSSEEPVVIVGQNGLKAGNDVRIVPPAPVTAGRAG